MKILLVGSDLALESTLEFYSKHALDAMGHQVECFDYLKSALLSSPEQQAIKSRVKSIFKFSPRKIFPGYRGLEKQKINSNLLNLVMQCRPDFILVFKGAALLPKTILKIKKELNIPIVNWLPENPFTFLPDDVYPLYDCLFMPDSFFIPLLYQKGAQRVENLAFGCDPVFHKHIELSMEERKIYSKDVCFIGSRYPQREEILESLLDFDIFISGLNWDKVKRDSPLIGRCSSKRLPLEEWRKYYSASKIILSLPNPNFVNGLIMREFEVPACGSFLITNETKDIPQFFNIGQEITCFKDKKELRNLIEYYLKNEDLRNSIARRGQEKACSEHTYIKRMEKVISVVEELRKLKQKKL